MARRIGLQDFAAEMAHVNWLTQAVKIAALQG